MDAARPDTAATTAYDALAAEYETALKQLG